MRAKIRLFPLVLLIAFVSLLLVSMDEFADDPGVGWHMATGEIILNQASVPRADPFLFSLQNRAWVSDQWLSDCLIALFYRLGHFPLLYALGVVLFIYTFFSLLYPTLKIGEGVAIPALIGAFFAFKIAQVHFILRPVLIAVLCFAILFRLLFPLYQSGERQLSFKMARHHLNRLYLWLPCLFLIWANLHPSFSLGLIFIALIVVGLFLDQFFFVDTWSRSDLLLRRNGFVILFLLTTLVTFINPAGWKLHQSILALSGNAFFMNYHQEWLSPDFSKPEGQFLEWFLFLMLLGLMVSTRTRRSSMVDFLVICFFTHAAFDAVRFLPFFGIVMSPYLVRGIQTFSVLTALPIFGQIAAAFRSIEADEFRSSQGWMVHLGCVLLLGWTIIFDALPFGHQAGGPSERKYPYTEMSGLQADTKLGTAVVAADPYFGGFITWQGKGQIRALIDDRNTLLGENSYQEFERFLLGKGDWQGYFRSLGATHIMLRRNDDFAGRLKASSELRLVTEGEVVSIFALSGSHNT